MLVSPYLVLLFFFSCCGHHRYLHSFLHDALPISLICFHSSPGSARKWVVRASQRAVSGRSGRAEWPARAAFARSEEHTSELQSHSDLVCRLLLEKKKNDEVAKAELVGRARPLDAK